MATTLSFREALNKGIATGTLVDTKIILFSRRNSSGGVCGPKAFYVSSHVLRSVPYFNDLLFGKFSEAEPKDFDDDFGNDGSTGDYDYYSDSDLEDDEDEKVTLPKPSHDVSRADSSKPLHFLGGGESDHENYTEHTNKGKIVRIPDMAFVTFQAFILYLYSGRIEFAPFGSRGNRSSETTDDEVPQPPSSKSVYRLADKYDTPVLKGLALSHIRSGLENCDIVEETFSTFTSRHDDIRKACVNQLLFTLQNDPAGMTAWMKVCDIIDAHFKGDIGHVTDTLSLLWRTANQDGGTTTTSDSIPSPTNIDDPASCNALRTAMVKSIRKGVFFDRKYWARHPGKGSTLEAIYFSSITAGNGLEACIRRSNNQSTLTKDSVGEADAESDCESDFMETGECVPASTQDGTEGWNGETRAVLSPGSFSTWRSLFFYKCTGKISFAPLRSQGVDSRLRYIIEKTTADAPPPCSPKSIYVLANLLRFKPLHDLALEDIKNKLSEDNIVEELFSRFTANEQQVVEMECRLLFSTFKNEATMSRVQEKIGNTSGNQLVHRAGPFKLGIRAALDLKKFGPLAGVIDGVMLRCSEPSCPGHDDRMSYSFAGSSCYCPRCKTDFMQCASYGSVRQDYYTSCRFCNKKFV